MFFKWYCSQVTLKASSQNKYWGRGWWRCRLKIKKHLSLCLVYSISSQQGEQKRAGRRDGDYLGWYCFQHPHIGMQWQPWTSHCVTYPVRPSWSHSGKHGYAFPCAPLPPGEEGWFGCLNTAPNPRAGWTPRVNRGSVSPWTCNVSDFAASSVTGDNITSLSQN